MIHIYAYRFNIFLLNENLRFVSAHKTFEMHLKYDINASAFEINNTCNIASIYSMPVRILSMVLRWLTVRTRVLSWRTPMIALVSTKTDCPSATNQKQAVVSRAKILVKYLLLMENLGALIRNISYEQDI